MFRFCVGKKKAVLTAWRQLVSNRRESCRRLAVLARRSARQTAVDAIRDFSWNNFVTARRRRYLTRLVKARYRGSTIVAFGVWKARCFQLVRHRRSTTSETLYHRERNDRFQREAR